jgi:hypothetical protein
MSTRTPDRFDRIAEKALKKSANKRFFAPAEVAEMMREEHRWVFDMVQQERREIMALERKTRKAGTPQDMAIAECLRSRIMQCNDILTKVKARSK